MRIGRSIGVVATLVLITVSATNLAAPTQPGGAKAFVDSLYRQYERAGKPPADQRVFTPELAGLIARDGAIAAKSGEPNLIDYGLLCSCNDDGGMRFATALVSSTPTTALIRVTGSVAGSPPTKPFTLRLSSTADGWRVADIVTGGPLGGSLLATLRKGLGNIASDQVAVPAVPTMRGRTGAGRQPRLRSTASVPAPPPAPVLPPFDLALSRGGLPLGDRADWSGIEIEKTSYSLAALRVTNSGGKLAGTADMRAPSRLAGATVAVSGKVKDGICQIKIDQFGSFKGPCSAAGFLGRKSFLGDTEASLYVYDGGAAAMARGVAGLPPAFGYAGKNDATFREDEFFTLHRSEGMLLGMWRNTFSEAGVIGAAFDGSCLLVTTGAYSFEGDCNAVSFRGRQLRGGKPSTTLALTGMTTQAVAAAIGGMEQRQAQAQATIQQAEAARQPPQTAMAVTADGSSGSDAPSGTQWFYGRDRWAVAPGGGCPPQDQLLRGYCFSQAIGFMRAHPSEGTQAVIALTAPAPLGTFISNDTPIRYTYVDVSRQGDGFVAKRVLHGTSKVNVPIQLAARCHGLSLRDGFVVVLGERGLREAALYPCS